MPKYLLTDIGSTFTKICYVCTDTCTIIGHAKAPTTVTTDVTCGFENALQNLTIPVDTSAKTLACSSAAGGLKIIAIGLVPSLTMEASRLAALGAGGKVIKAFSYRINNEDLENIAALNPDIILLSGGTNGGDCGYIINNAKKLQSRLPSIPLIIAGNKDAYDELGTIFKDRTDVYFTENVMPEFKRLNLEPARQLIRSVFLKRITIAKGLDRLLGKVTMLMPTPEAVFLAVNLLSRGINKQHEGIGELLAVDIGGATTDVYSCTEGKPISPTIGIKGLEEPYEKRTVEADIGMRYTLHYLIEQIDIEKLSSDANIEIQKIQDYISSLKDSPEKIPADQENIKLEQAIAAMATHIAVERHAGTLLEVWTPEGKVLLQHGKDLRDIQWIIGSGGPIISSSDPVAILKACLRNENKTNLTPVHARYLIDRSYILWAMGLLSQFEPLAALNIMKKYIIEP